MKAIWLDVLSDELCVQVLQRSQQETSSEYHRQSSDNATCTNDDITLHIISKYIVLVRKFEI